MSSYGLQRADVDYEGFIHRYKFTVEKLTVDDIKSKVKRNAENDESF